MVISVFFLIFANVNKKIKIMVKIAIYKHDNGSLLVIWRTPKENLVGEVYSNGIYKRGKWVLRATFEGRDATEYRVCEYFGFKSNNPYWRR